MTFHVPDAKNQLLRNEDRSAVCVMFAGLSRGEAALGWNVLWGCDGCESEEGELGARGGSET